MFVIFSITKCCATFKQSISAYFQQCSFHGQKCVKQTGTIFVVRMTAKNRKTAGSVRLLAVESIMEQLVKRRIQRLGVLQIYSLAFSDILLASIHQCCK